MSETKDKFGLGFRPQHYNWVTTHCPTEVDVFEIVSENFMGVGGRPMFHLDKLRENYPIIMHGVGLSIGSKGPLDPHYLKNLKDLTKRIQPLMVSDHLSWNQLERRNTHDLLPIVYTHESLNEIATKLGQIQDLLGQRFYLKNASAYVAFQEGDYDEAGFFAELLKRSGAGILLDVNNLYVNQRNLNQDPEHYLKSLRREDVGYFHLAGHSDQGDVLVDTHDHPVPDTVWELFGKAKEYFPGTPSIVEWDGNIPEFPELLAECEKARNHRSAGSYVPLAQLDAEASVSDSRGNLYNYSKFFDQIVKPFGITDDGLITLKSKLPVAAATGLKVYNHAYFLRLEEVLMDTYSALAFITEEEGFRYLVAAYLQRHPPIGSSIRGVGMQLAEFLRDPETQIDFDFGVPLDLLGDIAAVECARAEAFIAADGTDDLSPEQLRDYTPVLWETSCFEITPLLQIVPCNYEVLPTLKAIDQGEVPSPPDEKSCCYLIYRHDHSIHELEVTPEEARMLQALKKGASLLDLCDVSNGDSPGHYGSELITGVAGKILEWAGKGWLRISTRDAFDEFSMTQNSQQPGADAHS